MIKAGADAMLRYGLQDHVGRIMALDLAESCLEAAMKVPHPHRERTGK